MLSPHRTLRYDRRHRTTVVSTAMTLQPPTRAARKPQSLRQSLIDELCSMIGDGRLTPGDKLPTEVELMAHSGVSRSVVRAALSHLEVSGLVEIRRGIGSFVLNTPGSAVARLAPASVRTLQDTVAILDVRMSFEVEGAGIAALRRSEAQLQALREALGRFAQANDTSSSLIGDFQFHLQLAMATQNRYFTDIVSHFGTSMFPRARLNTVAIARLDRQQKHERLVREHEDIYLAVARQDADAARAAMRIHLSNSRARVLRSHPGAV